MQKWEKEFEARSKEIELIESLHPEQLPLYVNHLWSSKESKEHFLQKLKDATFQIQAMEDAQENENKPIIVDLADD